MGSLQEASTETKTHVLIQTWQRSARVNELGWSSQGVGSYYAHCAVGQLKLFGCFFWSYIYQPEAGGLTLQADALLCPCCRKHVYWMHLDGCQILRIKHPSYVCLCNLTESYAWNTIHVSCVPPVMSFLSVFNVISLKQQVHSKLGVNDAGINLYAGINGRSKVKHLSLCKLWVNGFLHSILSEYHKS